MHVITAVRDRGLQDLVVVCNSLGAQPGHPVTLVERGQARKLVAAFSARAGGVVGSAQAISPVPLEVELVPQGILVERLRSAGAGLGPFYSPVGQDTILTARARSAASSAASAMYSRNHCGSILRSSTPTPPTGPAT